MGFDLGIGYGIIISSHIFSESFPHPRNWGW